MNETHLSRFIPTDTSVRGIGTKLTLPFHPGSLKASKLTSSLSPDLSRRKLTWHDDIFTSSQIDINGLKNPQANSSRMMWGAVYTVPTKLPVSELVSESTPEASPGLPQALSPHVVPGMDTYVSSQPANTRLTLAGASCSPSSVHKEMDELPFSPHQSQETHVSKRPRHLVVKTFDSCS